MVLNELELLLSIQVGIKDSWWDVSTMRVFVSHRTVFTHFTICPVFARCMLSNHSKVHLTMYVIL